MKIAETKHGTYAGPIEITANLQEGYLGSTFPREFDSPDEIRRYFDPDHLADLFGEEINADEAAAVRDWAIHEWKKSRR